MRSRNATGRREEMAQAIDLTPMLDVVFIMLIFFIVTSVFIKMPGIDIQRTETVSGIEKKPAMLVAISSEDQIWVDRNVIERESVRISLSRLLADNPGGSLVIQADNESSLELVALITDVARDLGIADVSVSVEDN